ncbi:MAG: hypothetical protein LBC56_06055 [Oscillospiraceae bacterium]|nr:hypothetical protein [Oscillospiraceae bacterium]
MHTEPMRATLEELGKIIRTYEPEGLFYAFDETVKNWIEVDNSTDEAWTEDFTTEEACKAWILQE